MKALIIIDMQNDFISGSLGTPEAQAIVPKVAEKLKRDSYLDDEIIFTQDTHFDYNYFDTNEGKHLPVRHCIRATYGWFVHPSIDDQEFLHIEKNSFGYIPWKCVLDGFDEIELVGLCTDICVVSNALILKALFPEATITVDASCCAGTTPENHKAALQVMKSCQINVINEEEE